jgi:ADP-ribose pyrophosphatase
MKETLLNRKPIYNGRLISLFEDTVLCANGITASREIVDHCPAVVIVPIDDLGNITLIKQYRHAINDVIIECPAGCVNSNEAVLDAAKRELAEECGLKAAQWDFIHKGFPTPGFCNEIYHFFVAKSLSESKQQGDLDEVISVFKVSFSELEELVLSQKIHDIKTILAYYILKSREELL